MPSNETKADPFEILINAYMFHKATGVLATEAERLIREEDDRSLVNPMIVSECFSLELYLKCLLGIRRIHHDYQHDPKELFGKLDAADQQKIDTYCQESVANYLGRERIVGDGVALDLNSILDRLRDLFVRSRYWFERKPMNRDSSGKASNAGIGNLASAVRRLIFELEPDWEDRLRRVYIKISNDDD